MKNLFLFFFKRRNNVLNEHQNIESDDGWKPEKIMTEAEMLRLEIQELQKYNVNRIALAEKMFSEGFMSGSKINNKRMARIAYLLYLEDQEK